MRAPLLAFALALASFRPATAQLPDCSSLTGSSRRICDAALDGTRAFHPVAAQLLPTDQIDHLTVDPDARRLGDVALGFGYGMRVGVLRDEGPLPAVSVSAMRRSIPKLAYGDLDQGDQFSYAVDLQATNLRLIASKQFAALQVAGGVGWDRYTGDAEVRLREQPGTGLGMELKESRAMAFLNAGLELAPLSIVGEAGYQSGRDRELSTDFEDFDTGSGKFFAGFGLRVGL